MNMLSHSPSIADEYEAITVDRMTGLDVRLAEHCKSQYKDFDQN